MGISKNHHTVPQCYLKHFTHNDKHTQLFLYDKLKDEVRPGNIERSFTTKHRNATTGADGKKTAFLEDLYGDIENSCASVLEKIANGNATTVLPIPDLYVLAEFVATQFWRVPYTDDRVKEMMQKQGLGGTHFFMKYPDGWTDETKQKLEAQLMAHPDAEKYYHMMLMFEPFFNKKYIDALEKWKIYYNDPGFYFTSDNPIIVSSIATPKNILDELILPLAPGRVLVASGGKPPELDPKWTYYHDMQQVKQAERYVASSNEAFLNALVKEYRKFRDYEKDLTGIFKPHLFRSVT